MKNIIIISLILSVLFVISCDSSDSPTNNVSTEDKIERLKSFFDSLATETDIPGVVAGIWIPEQDLELIHAAGKANMEMDIDMTPDLIFRIGSNTKTMTNTVLLQLIDKGYLTLETTLSEYYPNFPQAESITIEMLTNMSSGIEDYIYSPRFNELLSEDLSRTWEPDSLIGYAAELDFIFAPGGGFYYSNTNTILIGRIIEMITGNSLEEEMEARIFSPLGLTQTQFITTGTELPSPHPIGYYAGSADDEPADFTEVLDASLTGAAGAAVSTLSDLKAYVEALVGGTLLSDEMQNKRLNSFIDIPEAPFDLNYGIGWCEVHNFYGHDGVVPGFSSAMLSNPYTGATIIFWYNCQLFEFSVMDMFNEVHAIIYDKSYSKSDEGFKLSEYRVRFKD